MDKPDGKVTPLVDAGPGVADLEKDRSVRQVEAASEEGKAEEKPQASEEIVIEEISIDGMCGVY